MSATVGSAVQPGRPAAPGWRIRPASGGDLNRPQVANSIGLVWRFAPARAVREAGNDPHIIFDHFYRTMAVARFGRLGKFDFLCLVGRLGIAPIAPGVAYLSG